MATEGTFQGRNAVIFAATGEIAAATALEVAKRGARLFLSGRDLARVRSLAKRIAETTGVEVDACRVDAENRSDIARHFESLASRGVSPDWTFNGIGLDPVKAMYGHRSGEVATRHFLEPLVRIVGSQFLTATLAAAQMRRHGCGTIVLLTSSLAKSSVPYMAGITAASDAVQGMARVLAAEYAPLGLRVHCVRVDGIPETRTIRFTSAAIARTSGTPTQARAASAAAGEDTRPLTLQAAAMGIVAATAPDRTASAGQPIDVEA